MWVTGTQNPRLSIVLITCLNLVLVQQHEQGFTHFGPCNSFKEFAEVSRNFPKEMRSSKGRYNSVTNRTETDTFMVNKRLTMG